ncbi:esterase, partial [Nguyenibacter vanlangensis]|nr:esterase [Nguyenibacter vanlangensis]
SFPLAEGYATLEPGAVSVPMRATCCTLQPGERLRLSLALACFPSFPVNPGTGRPPWEAGIFDHQVVTVRLRRDKSILHVPLRAAEEQA